MQDVGFLKDDESMIPLHMMNVSNGDAERPYRPYRVME